MECIRTEETVQNMSIAVLLLLAVSVNCLTDLTIPEIFFPFGTDNGDRVVPVGDGTSSPAINITTARFMFFNVKRDTVYVSLSRFFVRYCVDLF